MEQSRLIEIPSDAVTYILSEYCDATSISKLAIAISTSNLHGSLLWDVIVLTLNSRVNDLRNQGMTFPSRSGFDLYKNLSFRPSDGLSQAAEKFLALSYFEDAKTQLRTAHGVELPIFLGPVTIDFSNPDDRDTTRLETVNIIASSPSDTWDHSIVHEWKRYSSQINQCPIQLGHMPPRFVISPHVVRIQGLTEEDSEIVKNISEALDKKNLVANILGLSIKCDRYDSSYVFMSRRQAQSLRDLYHEAGYQTKSFWPIDYQFDQKLGVKNNMLSECELFAFTRANSMLREKCNQQHNFTNFVHDIVEIKDLFRGIKV